MPFHAALGVSTRRAWLRAVGLAALGAAVPKSLGAATEPRRLSFYGLHTGESLDATYWTGVDYDAGALSAIDHVLRDHRTGDVKAIDTRLLDLLASLRLVLGSARPLHVISGYRSPATNAALHRASEGVATNSLHLQGRAIDIRVPGVELPRLHRAAVSLEAGGVGFYPASQFVHVDVGRVRYW
ncbi:MAG: DUF882 domain-containing protein [Vicinamibacterales bacterium]